MSSNGQQSFELGLHKLDYTKENFDNKTLAFIAPHESGKSWLIRYLMKYLKDIPESYVFCVFEKNKTFYEKFIPEMFIDYDGFEIKEVERLMNQQNKRAKMFRKAWKSIEKFIEKQYKKGKINKITMNKTSEMIEDIRDRGHYSKLGEEKYETYKNLRISLTKNMKNKKYWGLIKKAFEDPRALLIFDDCMGEKSFEIKKGNALYKLFIRGRHDYWTNILTLQYAKGLGPKARENYDYLFFLGSIDNCEVAYSQFGSMFSSTMEIRKKSQAREYFQNAFHMCTRDFKAFVYKKCGGGDLISDRFFWTKSKRVRGLKCCDKKYWLQQKKEKQIKRGRRALRIKHN